MANEIAVYDRVQDPMEFIEKMGTSIAQSGMFGCRNIQQGMVLAMACLTEKKNPIELARTFHIIDGQLSMRADAMLAEFRVRGGKCRWLNIGDDGKEARAVFVFDGQELEIAFTIEDARKMQLIRPNGNWVKSPGAMLRARCTSKAIRILAPEIVAGVYAPEELGDGIATDPAAGNGNVIDGEFTWPDSQAAAKAAEKEAAPKVDAKELIRQKAAERKAKEKAAANGHQEPTPGDNGEEAVGETERAAPDASEASADHAPSEPPFDAGGESREQSDDDEASGAVESSPTGPSDGPCSSIQVEQLRTMTREIAKSDPKIEEKLRKALAAQGKSKFADLSRSEADQLLNRLYQKAAGERLAGSSKKN